MFQNDKLINYRVLDGDANEILGTVNVTLPKIEYETDEIKGAGLAGPVDTPTPMHFKSMTMEMEFRTISKQNVSFSEMKTYSLVFLGAQHRIDTQTGQSVIESVRVATRVMPKSIELGKGETASKTGTKNTFEVLYIKIEVDGKEQLELDKFNYVYRVNGKDSELAKAIRKALGYN